MRTARYISIGHIGGSSRAQASPKTFQRPNVQPFVVSQNIEVSIGGAHAKIESSRGIPAVLDLSDLEHPASQRKAQRPLIGSVSRMAFD